MPLRMMRRAARRCYRLGASCRPPTPPFATPRKQDTLSVFDDISILQLALIAAVAVFTSLIGGVTGYGTGALMPLVLVPIVGPEPVVPIIAISATLTNLSRALAFRGSIDWRRARLVVLAAFPTCILGAWAYTLLSGPGAMLLIGAMLVAVVALRRLVGRYGFHVGDRGLAVGAGGWGLVVGGTNGAGVIIITLLMAAGLTGAAVIGTDAALSVAVGLLRLAVFGVAGVATAKVLAVALLIGAVTFPGAFLARLLVKRLPVHVHTAMLDVVVVIGGVVMIAGAVGKMG
jgi:uncharacterized membrane protein YfcA